MYELIQAGENTYYIECPAKMGVYRLNNDEVCLIDSGNDKDAGKKVLKVLQSNGFKLKLIINTHSHADHVGGNNFLQERTGCSIYAAGLDRIFINNPVLEPSFLYGGYACKKLKNKFLFAQSSRVEELTEANLPEGLSMMRIDGHTFSMIALKTSDDVWFLADALTSEEILNKYHISFLYDVEEYLKSLQLVNKLEGRLFIPAHAPALEDIHPLVEVNINKVHEIINLIKKITLSPVCFEDILKAIFDEYGLALNFNQYALGGSTIRSYLSYLHDKNELDVIFENNKLLFVTQV